MTNSFSPDIVGRMSAVRDDILTRFRDEFAAEELARPTSRSKIRGARIIEESIEYWDRQFVTEGSPPIPNKSEFAQSLLDDLLGLGPLQELMDSPDVEEILINGFDRVFTIEGRKRHRPDIVFRDDEHLRQIISRVLASTGRTLTTTSPMVDARLPDGSRLNAVIPPIVSHTAVSIRKHLRSAMTVDQLVSSGMLTDDAGEFLIAAVRGGFNILVAGGTGAGKTTFLNALIAVIDDIDERVITCEEVMELQTEELVADCVAMEARPETEAGAGAVPVRALVRNALRMRPTRIIVGEVRGAEAIDMLSAMNSGHDGSMCTIHANDSRSAIEKLTIYAMMADEELPQSAITMMIARAIHIIVHIRQDLGTRLRVVESIYEIRGIDQSASGPLITGAALWERTAGTLEYMNTPTAYGERIVRGGWMGGPRSWLPS